MRNFILLCLLCLNVVSALGKSTITPCVPESTRKFFAFGDSYADTGNTRNTSAWRAPAGVTWPGKPAGRFSDGLIQTDVLASKVLHVASPTSYGQYILNTSIPVSGGINFAVGGSGATFAYGLPPFSTQVKWFSALVEAGAFTPDDLKKAVFLVTVVGNDYGAYNGSAQGYLPYVHQVVKLIDIGIRQLYSQGARNFMVSSLSPLDCLPSRTFEFEFEACDKNSTLGLVISTHNYLLGRRLENITKSLEGSNVVYLQQTKAIKYIQKHPSEFGLTEGFEPCCLGSCTEVDSSGNPLYRVCKNPDKHLFWDTIHPTQAGWNAVVDLYRGEFGFTTFYPSLKAWVENLCVKEVLWKVSASESEHEDRQIVP